MRTTHASKSVRNGGTTQTKRYWYYTSKPTGATDKNSVERLPAKEIERVVLSNLRSRLIDKTWLADQAGRTERVGAPTADILQAADDWRSKIAASDNAANVQSLGDLIDRIDAQRDRLCIRLNLHALLEPNASCVPLSAAFEVPFQKWQSGCARPIVIVPEDAPRPDPDLIACVADARRWARELLEGKAVSIQHITERESLRSGSVSRILPLAWLAPDISTAILECRQPPNLTAKSLRSLSELPLHWEEQRRILGFPHRCAWPGPPRISVVFALLRLSLHYPGNVPEQRPNVRFLGLRFAITY